MQILKKANDIGPATALTPKERSMVIDMARIGKKDVFYDLGSGNGRLVVDVIKKTKGRAVGLEIDYQRFCNSVRFAQRSLSQPQLDRIDFYCVSYDEFDFSDATVIYEGHERERHEVEMFTEKLGAEARIITLDLPLVRCNVIKCAPEKKPKFFMSITPLNKFRAKNKNQWACWALQRTAKISDVYAHLDTILKRRGFSKYIRLKAQEALRNIVNNSFRKT